MYYICICIYMSIYIQFHIYVHVFMCFCLFIWNNYHFFVSNWILCSPQVPYSTLFIPHFLALFSSLWLQNRRGEKYNSETIKCKDYNSLNSSFFQVIVINILPQISYFWMAGDKPVHQQIFPGSLKLTNRSSIWIQTF